MDSPEDLGPYLKWDPLEFLFLGIRELGNGQWFPQCPEVGYRVFGLSSREGTANLPREIAWAEWPAEKIRHQKVP